jgi:hypothetical protein
VKLIQKRPIVHFYVKIYCFDFFEVSGWFFARSFIFFIVINTHTHKNKNLTLMHKIDTNLSNFHVSNFSNLATSPYCARLRVENVQAIKSLADLPAPASTAANNSLPLRKIKKKPVDPPISKMDSQVMHLTNKVLSPV